MATDPWINRTFDRRYLILRKLGSGGMADVYLAEDEELGRKVALKLLNERHARDEQFVERFKREARNAAGLSHPHIVRIYDRGQAEDTYYIAMEYLDGPTLKELLVRKGPTPPLTAIKFAREILSALGEAHRHDIVHRDIKPHNVIVGPDWHIKVTDFGIARSGASQMTEAGSIVGTAQYLSPEQARGAPVDQRSDLYSLGIVLYELLTGKVPFTGDAAVEIAMKHLSAIPDPPSKLRPEISHDLDAVVMRALAKDPEQRYASAEEMDADLARVARGAAVSERTEETMTEILSGTGVGTAPTTVSRPTGAPGAPTPPPYRPPAYYEEMPRRRSRWPAVLGLLAVAILGAIGFLIYHKVSSAIDSNRTIAVKDVRSVPKTNAVLLLKQQGLLVRVDPEPNETVPKDLVIGQNPGPGVRVAKDTTVTLTVSTGKPKVNVPDVRKKSLADALAALATLGLKANQRSVPSTDVPVGSVTAQSPAPGTLVLTGSAVYINVSAGPKLIAIPSGVVGEPYENAQSAIKGAGFVPVREDVNAAAPIGEVTSESPSAGSLEPAGTKVTLQVSKGPKTVSVPYVVGDNQSDAVQLLTQQGFIPSVVQQDVSETNQDGLVLQQSPSSGSLKQGGAVTIIVGHFVAPTLPTTATTPTTPATTSTPTTIVTTTTTDTTTTATTPTTDTTTTTGGTTTTATTPTTTTGSTTTVTTPTTPTTTPTTTAGVTTPITPATPGPTPP